MKKLKVLVTDSTGWQGSAVAQWLLASGHDVVAVTQDLAHPVAMQLMRRGARLAWASPDDRAAAEENVQGCDALFLAVSSDADLEAEIRDGTMMVDVAAASGVAHVVYASLPAAAEPTGVPHFDSKHAIEKRLAQQNVHHTVVAPAWLMENFTTEHHLQGLREGSFRLPYPAGRKLQQVAVDDVARFVTLVLEQPSTFVGRRVAIAGDELTGIEMAATFARILARPLAYEEQSLASARATDPRLAGTFEYLAREDPAVDVPALRDAYDVNWHTLDGWARRRSWDELLGGPGRKSRGGEPKSPFPHIS